MFLFDDEEDAERARRRWNAYLDEIDAEIREESTPEFQAERAAEAESRRRWADVPSSRTPQGTRCHAMTDEQMFRADLEGR